MLNVKNLLFLAWIVVHFSIIATCVEQKSEITIERKKMNKKEIFSVVDHEVTFFNTKEGITLSGTLSIPLFLDKSLAPVVILVPGMGPVDRDCTFGAHKLFLTISNYLTACGIAVLRYDKRGVGKSGGIFNTDVTSSDLSQDLLAAVAFLKTSAEIDQEKIGLIGMSEGGLISFMVASECLDVKYMVSMAGAVVTNVVEQTGLQLKADGASEDFIERDRQIRTHIFTVIQAKSQEQAKDILLFDVKKYIDSLTEEEKIQVKTLPFALT
jgi:alpha/beta superfamily hydrolase